MIPSGDGAVAPDDLPAALEALARSYAFVVVHAGEWDSPAVARLAADMAALMLVAAPSEIAGIETRARAAFKDEGLAIKAIASGAPGEPEERAA